MAVRASLAAWIIAGIATSASIARADPETAVLIGTVRDITNTRGVPDAFVIVSSPALLGVQRVVTAADGAYRISGLPPGKYLLALEKEGFEPYSQSDIDLSAGRTIRLNVELVPVNIEAIEVVVHGSAPTLDMGSSAIDTTVVSDFTQRVPLVFPGEKGAATRSFEAVAMAAPGARPDTYGAAFAGTTSPENQYIVDGLSVGHPGVGLLALPLSTDFVREMRIVTGGLMPEYGRAMGGVLNVITKSGSNEVHGSTFGSFTPGALEGPRAAVPREGSTILTTPALSSIQNFGFDVGGPVIKDKLWFYGGFDIARTRYDLGRLIGRMVVDSNGDPVRDPSGFTSTEPLAGTERTETAVAQNVQALAKLDFAPNTNHRFTLEMLANPYDSGGQGTYGINPLTGLPEVGTENTVARPSLAGERSALAHRYLGSSTAVLGKWSAAYDNQRFLVDTTAGWMYARFGRLAGDGSGPGDGWGAASIPNTLWWLEHPITDFERVPNPAACTHPTTGATLCPVTLYRTGGAEYLDIQTYNRFHLKTVGTHAFRAAGRHVLKAGIDLEIVGYDHRKGYAGGRDLAEYPDPSVPVFVEGRQYGYLSGPDQPVLLATLQNRMSRVTWGGFVQDSYQVVDEITIQAGLRYDAEYLYAGDGGRSLSFPAAWSPRVGAIVDPTREGRSRLFAQYGVYYQSLPLDIMDRVGTAEPHIASAYAKDACDPRDPSRPCGANARVPGVGNAPNLYYWPYSAGRPAVDPQLAPPSSGEIVLGGEYEIMPKGRVGVSYTWRRLYNTVEDMSRDGANSFFIGNPGRGIAKDFPAAERMYDAITATFIKGFSNRWLAQASYTLSWLRGNYAGLYRPEDGQLNPNTTTDFDLRELLVNRWGPLPGDRRHQFKLYGAKDFALGGGNDVLVGIALRGHSGDPTSRIGASAVSGYADQVFITPRGSEERLPWVFSFDLRLGYAMRFANTTMLSVSMDVFNLFNFQEVVSVDERYTAVSVQPSAAPGQAALRADGSAVTSLDVNPNYGRPTAHQPPRAFRFALKATF